MRAKIRNNYNDNYSITVHLPSSPMELYDMLDRLGVDNKPDNVYINIEDEYIPETMREGGFYDDIFKLNLLAERIESMSDAETAGFTAVLYDHEDYNLDDLILVTYGMDAYPIYPCSTYAELGDIVIDNDMISEVESYPDELIPHLDKSSVGRLAAERFKGTFVNGYYCEVADYEPPDMKITIEKPDWKQFQILVGTDEKSAQWTPLPYEGELSDKDIYGVRSPLPRVKVVDDISKLNKVAERIAELDRPDIIKLKAVMENGCLRGAAGALFALEILDKFEIDNCIRIYADFGREYLRRQLYDNFDMSVLNTEYLSSVGSKILDRKGDMLTSYGAVSGLGSGLYSAITVQDDESIEEEFDEEQELNLS